MKANGKLFLETYVQRLMDSGIGRIEIVEFKPEEGEMKFRIRDNFFAQINYQKWTACDYVKGLVTGIYEQMANETPKVEETKCIGKGDPYCEWQITSSQ
jgi:predicted hydrocarbon binding protein